MCQQPPEGTECPANDRSKELPSLGRLSEGFQAPQGDPEAPSSRSPPLDMSGSVDASAGASCMRLSAGQWFAREERKAIDAYVQDRELEVVVILEGTDTSTGSTVQVTSPCRVLFLLRTFYLSFGPMLCCNSSAPRLSAVMCNGWSCPMCYVVATVVVAALDVFFCALGWRLFGDVSPVCRICRDRSF